MPGVIRTCSLFLSAFLSSLWCQDGCLQLGLHCLWFQSSREGQGLGLIASDYVLCLALNQEQEGRKSEALCYSLSCLPSPSSYDETLTSSMMVFGDGGLWEIVKFRCGHEDRVLMMRLVPL